MTKEFDPQDALDFIDMDVMPSWVVIRDHNKECKRQGKDFDQKLEENLNDILSLFHEGQHKEGFIKYVDLLHQPCSMISQQDIDLLKEYAKYLGLDPKTLDDVMSIEEAEEKGLFKWPSAAIDNQE